MKLKALSEHQSSGDILTVYENCLLWSGHTCACICAHDTSVTEAFVIVWLQLVLVVFQIFGLGLISEFWCGFCGLVWKEQDVWVFIISM